ncbi:Chemotaxis protein CheW [Pseudovibrio sp. W64]|jgi:purine-binding chemotaxis protein CheW|uniref:Purine-binding chemotaxis protein CheW n=1 Tax=Pseudovibrio ascidiaceicola TaxID=285279 RepID=A0A1I4APH6_9HYPH|nr:MULTISPECIES: chemotaxis protein CheW [Pseudovibrio]KZK76757.1 Chemotaxis protein CheW [Pseudovibrio sp. Ad46]KZK77346.1 Chemotaxis protein CheW [Pseudovibrio sp. W64]KZK85864.1 Chemotaxis protein CheW [Pseudovibrio sp. Ad13]KZK98346.1 Chemotaxis protein CheW [Pseudovibrio sp. Ad26]KZK99572.1 Chemotaxis protein CheW [Pseudovibrio sp. Ad5]
MTAHKLTTVDGDDNRQGSADHIQYVTVVIGSQLFGLPISQVHDVFVPEKVTQVPLAPPEVEGVLNLRGRIVTAINMRRKLHLKPNDADQGMMAVGIEYKGESYGLVIDAVGEVLNLPRNEMEANPSNLDFRWAEISGGVHRLDGRLMVVLDVDRLLSSLIEPKAA